MIKKLLNRSLLSRPLSEAEAIQAYRTLKKSRRFGRDTWSDGSWCYQANWITDDIFDLKHLTEGSERIGSSVIVEGLSRIGRLINEEWWREWWRDDVPERMNMSMGLILRNTISGGTHSVPYALRLFKQSYQQEREVVRWTVWCSEWGLDQKASKEKRRFVPPEWHLPVMEQLLSVVGLEFPLHIEGDKLMVDCPAALADTSENRTNPRQPVVVSFGGGEFKVPTVAKGMLRVSYVSKDEARLTSERLLAHFGRGEARIDSWSHTYRFAFAGSARKWLPGIEPPPYEVSFDSAPMRVYEPEELAEFRDTQGEFIPLGYLGCGAPYFTVEALSLGQGPEAQWQLVFNAAAMDSMTDKARAKAQASIEQLLNIPRLFACEQLVEKYAHLCRQV